MERLEDLSLWQSQLIEEEELIIKLLADIEEQINYLEIEQMELASAKREKDSQSKSVEPPPTQINPNKVPEKLDLAVPTIKNSTEEEEEDDAEDDL